MRRAVPAALIGLGAFLLALAVLLPTLVVPRLEKAPLDVYSINVATGTGEYLNPETLEFATDEEWKAPSVRLGAKLHPLTIEQNAITSFKSRTTLVPAYANTIGPGIFLKADWAIGGCDGTLSRGMMWQGLSLWTTLRHGPSRWIPSSFMPTRPGRLHFVKELAGPLVAECN